MKISLFKETRHVRSFTMTAPAIRTVCVYVYPRWDAAEKTYTHASKIIPVLAIMAKSTARIVQQFQATWDDERNDEAAQSSPEPFR